MTEAISIFTALGGGLLSFFSPCVLALFPTWLAWLAGVNLTAVGSDKSSSARLLVSALWFALGFTLVFIALGASLGWVTSWLHQADIWLARIGGIVMILLGLAVVGLIKTPWLSRPHQREIPALTGRKLAPWLLSFLGGLIFSVSWTPCVSPILAGILVLAGIAGSVQQGSLLLLFYSLGLVIPLIAISLVADQAQKFLSDKAKWFNIINKVAGVILVIIGILLVTGNFTRWLSFFNG